MRRTVVLNEQQYPSGCVERSKVGYFCGIRMRFRPNKWASTDHAPGPIIARAAPIAANTMSIDAPLKSNKRRDSSAAAMSKPAIGVQRPTTKSAEHAAAKNPNGKERG